MSENAMAAAKLIAAGRADEARKYVARSHDLREALGVTAERTEWVDTFSVWERWVKGDVEGALAILRRLAAMVDQDGHTHLRRTLAPWFTMLGLLRESDALLLKRLEETERAGGKPSEVMPEIGLAWNDELRGNRAGARRWIQRLCRRVSTEYRVQWFETVILESRVGLTEEVRASLDEPDPEWRTYGKGEYAAWAEGELALAGDRPHAAVSHMARALAVFRQEYITRGLAVQTLSSALEASRGPEAALAAIVDYLDHAPSRPDRIANLLRLNGSAWLDLQARKARLLRRLGRPAEAKPIEAQLRKVLACADEDLLLLRQLSRE